MKLKVIDKLERRNKGLILVAVLWIVMILGVITADVGRSSRLDSKTCLAGLAGVRCKWACRAGIDSAVGVLNDDIRRSDSLNDSWSNNDADFNNVQLAGCSFTVRVVDEAGKLNVNVATKEQLMALPYMTEEIANSILDWVDTDSQPREGGAEGGYYEGLRYGYMARDGSLRSIRDLLAVKGVSEDILYGYDSEQSGNSSKVLMQRNSSSDQQRDEELGWIEYLTCYSVDRNKDAWGNNRTNINEASQDDMVNNLSITRGQAKWIVDNKPNGNYQSISDLINKDSPKEAKEGADANEAVEMDLETFKKIADKISITNDEEIQGKVNVNTASKVVLEALFEKGDRAKRLADSIIAYRQQQIDGMESIGDLLKVNSLEVDDFKKIANKVTTRSDIYTVKCAANARSGRLGGASMLTEAVLDRKESPCTILYWYQGVNN